MSKDYDTFVMSLSDIEEGKEIELTVRDCDTYQPKAVRAVVSSSMDKLPGADRLWLRWSRGQSATKDPWAIKIVQDLGDPLERQQSSKLADGVHIDACGLGKA